MANANPGAKARPLSPHLQIWRWGPAMAVSILHRITGNGLAVVGIPMLLWWVSALAGGPEAYAKFSGWVWADCSALVWFGGLDYFLGAIVRVVLKIVLVGLSWAFFTHLASGIRHFVLDIGAGFELERNAFWSVVTPVLAILLTAAFWAALLLR